MEYLVLTNTQYDNFKSLDIAKFYLDMKHVGFTVLKDYKISTYDVNAILSLNSHLGLNKKLYRDFLGYFNTIEYEVCNMDILKDLSSGYQDTNHECKITFTNGVLLIVLENLFFNRYYSKTTRWKEDVLNYIYNRFGEHEAVNSEILKLKVY